MFKIAPEHERAEEAAEIKEEKPMIKVKFIKSYFQYRPGQTATLEESYARELIEKSYAQEQET